ncbi:MAG TPA: hypothetical protein VNT99_18570 [Methylomirabilota bacterium]|nr:hypothetical protein [Methylomirabilota bacterium]
MKVTAGIMGAISMALLVGCEPANDKVPKAGEPMTPQAGTVGAAESTNERTSAQQKLSDQLSALDSKMAELKTRAQKAGDEARSEWEAGRPQL